MYQTDNGASYNGQLNISKYGKPCDLWSDVKLDFATSTLWIGEFENNFCRKTRWNPPSCYFNNKRASCNIPECGEYFYGTVRGIIMPLLSSNCFQICTFQTIVQNLSFFPRNKCLD